jgi:glycerophosphoryl diester phosphodiesterase
VPQVPTVEEYIEVALAAGATPIGIYPETKHPSWHDGLGIMKGTSISDLLLEILDKKGYKGNIKSKSWAQQPCFIQSFEVCSNFTHSWAGRYMAGKCISVPG